MLDELEALHKRLLRLETIAFDAAPCCGEAAECVVGVWTVVYADMNFQEKRQANESGAFSGMKMRLVQRRTGQHVLEICVVRSGVYTLTSRPLHSFDKLDPSLERLALKVHGFYGGSGSLSLMGQDFFSVDIPGGATVKFGAKV
jgi:hypothetical protein